MIRWNFQWTCTKKNNPDIEQMFIRNTNVGFFEKLSLTTWAVLIVLLLLLLQERLSNPISIHLDTLQLFWVEVIFFSFLFQRKHIFYIKKTALFQSAFLNNHGPNHLIRLWTKSLQLLTHDNIRPRYSCHNKSTINCCF